VKLWDWAAGVYAAPGVEAACLELQDRWGQSVCLLLWAGWAAGRDASPGAETVGAAAVLARTWEAEVIGPLRRARRALKRAPGLGEVERAALRTRARDAELAAERALLAALEALTPAPGAAGGPMAAVMARAVAAWGEPAPAEALLALAEALAAA
jgi:uncharacterized protein (TIGR02444 family)